MKTKLLVLPLLALALAACGGTSSSSQTPTESGPTASETPTTDSTESTDTPESTDPTPGTSEPGSDAPESIEGTLLETISFSEITETGGSAWNDTTVAAGLTGFGTNVTWTGASYVYPGGGAGGAMTNKAGLIKFGRTDDNGSLKFTVNQAIKTIVLSCQDFKLLSTGSPAGYVIVNEMTGIQLTQGNEKTATDVTFVFDTAATEITIKTAGSADGTGKGRMYLYSISLYVAA